MTTEMPMPLSFTVAVGSSNPSKIRSVQQALEQIITDVPLVLCGYAVESGVADQPYGDDMTRLGAQNRAHAAFEAYTQDHGGVEPHLAVGLEGGLEEIHAHYPNDRHNKKNKKKPNINYLRAAAAIVRRYARLARMGSTPVGVEAINLFLPHYPGSPRDRRNGRIERTPLRILTCRRRALSRNTCSLVASQFCNKGIGC